MASTGSYYWGPDPFTLSVNFTDPATLITQLEAARARGHQMVLNMTGGSHERYKTDGKFDFAKWKSRMDAYRTPELQEAVRAGVANGTIVMNSVMDEPQIKDWGGVMTKPLLDQMAAYVKAIFPTLTVGVVVRWDWRPEERYQVMDVILAQYQWNKGDVVAYRDNVLARARLEGVDVVFSMNLLGGGIYSWITKVCPIPLTGGPGPYIPVCKVTPDQLRDWGRILGVAGCAMTLWRYDEEFWANPANLQAINDVAATIASVPARPCRQRNAPPPPPPPPNIPPKAAFDPPTCTVGIACQFTDGSTDEDGTLSAWSWDFGAESRATEANPSHTFATSGSYSVTLGVIDDAGGADVVTRTVLVEDRANALPTAAFDPLVCTAGLACRFTDRSSDEDGTLRAWSWDFGNGGHSTRQHPARTYAEPGTYDVTLEVTDDVGGTNAVTHSVTVEAGLNRPPTAAFEPPRCTARTACQFTDGSSDEDGTLSEWSWDFANEAGSAEANPSHTFAAGGLYGVTLEVTDDAGGTDAVTQTVTVDPAPNALPLAAFDPPSCTAGTSCQFTDGSSDPDGTLTAWSWEFGDGAGATSPNPTRTYTAAGDYSVTLTVTDDAGGTDAVTRTVPVEVRPNARPTAAFSPPSCTAGVACQFTDGSSDPDGRLSGWSWDFGDGSSSALQNPTLTYASAGTYSVTLQVTDDASATDAVTRSVTVVTPNAPPTAAFTPPSCTAGTPCQFTDASHDEDGALSAWSWDFGDGAGSTLRNPAWTYASAGTFTVTLSVTDDDLASGRQSALVVVAAAPVPITLSVSGRVDATKQYMTLKWSSTAGASVDVYRNGLFLINTANDGLYTNSRSLPGSPSYTYKVCRVGTTSCSNEATVTFGAPPPNAAPRSSFTASCGGLACTFTDASTDSDGVIASWSWAFGDGATSTARRPTRTYARAGTYSVTLRVTDDDGASHQSSATVSVGPIALSVSGRVDATKQYMALSWTGAAGTMVNVYRNGTLIKSTENDGKYTNSRTFTGPATYIYRLCQTTGTTCSNNATVVFK